MAEMPCAVDVYLFCLEREQIVIEQVDDTADDAHDSGVGVVTTYSPLLGPPPASLSEEAIQRQRHEDAIERTLVVLRQILVETPSNGPAAEPRQKVVYAMDRLLEARGMYHVLNNPGGEANAAAD